MLEIKKNLSKCTGFNKVRNSLPINLNESLEHLQKKLEVAYSLVGAGNQVLCEAKFLTGGRCDVYDLTNDIAYEILKSEKEANIEKKRTKYPVREIRTIKVEL